MPVDDMLLSTLAAELVVVAAATLPVVSCCVIFELTEVMSLQSCMIWACSSRVRALNQAFWDCGVVPAWLMSMPDMPCAWGALLLDVPAVLPFWAKAAGAAKMASAAAAISAFIASSSSWTPLWRTGQTEERARKFPQGALPAQPLTAASSAAMSNLTMLIIASAKRRALAGSGSPIIRSIALGTICQ